MASEASPRYSTEISKEHYYKYRTETRLAPGSLYYGKDTDTLYKAWTGAKRGSIFAVGLGMAASTYQKGPFSFSVAAEQGFRHGMPWLIAGTTYGVAVGLTANIRHKEGPLNHFIGGYAAGTMIGAWYKSPKIGAWAGVVLAAFGGMFKMMHDNDVDIHGELRRPRVFNYYRTGWFTERPPQEGRGDPAAEDSYKEYRP